MTALTEGNIRITLPAGTTCRKFDSSSHGLSHCMKAVDFVVELSDRVLFVEIKDPQNPHAIPANATAFFNRFQSGEIDEDLKYKYRDSFLYEWASGRTHKPVHYYVIVAISSLGAPDMLARTEALKRKLPLKGPSSGDWKRGIVADCLVVNIQLWNRYLPNFQATRI